MKLVSGAVENHSNEGHVVMKLGVNLSRGWRRCVSEGELTDGGENAGEAEVVDGVEREQVEEELLLLLLAA